MRDTQSTVDKEYTQSIHDDVGSGRVLGCDVWLAGSCLLRLGTFGMSTCGWNSFL